MGRPRFSERARSDNGTDVAVRAFLRRLEGRYAVRECILFGSRARHAHHAESDVDLAIVLEGPRGDRGRVGHDMAGIAVDVLLETGLLVEALPLWNEELTRPDLFSNPALIEAIHRDGIRV